MKKKLLAVILSAAMAFTAVPSAALAAPADPEADAAKAGGPLAELAAQLQDPANDPFNYSPHAMLAAENTYPAAYDLRDVNGTSYVTPVKFQNPFGTCWGFAAIAAAESSILGSGLAAKDGYNADTLDLSEKHLTYFVSQPINDPANPQNGEGTHADADVTVSDLLNGGGLPFTATSLFASGIGPNLESRDPLLKYMGKNGWTEKRTVNGKVIDYCYDDEDDWSLPEEWRFRQSYVLKESFMLPSPAEVNSETGEYTYNPAGTEAIKEMLVNKRAVQIGFCADTSSPSQEAGDGVYISKNWAHYTYDAQESPNHAVTIVGWDDTYDKANFVEGHEPPESGAWLVKNSWGSEEQDFPNRGPGWGIEKNGVHTGYFWLSYYDKTISMPEALEFEKSNVNNTYNIDEHDFMPVNDVSGAVGAGETRMANVFRADACEMLERVSCETTVPGTKVVNQVYLLADDFTDPADGKLVDETEAEFAFGGFHTMALSSPDLIQKGQYYSVVQTQITPEGEYAFNLPFSYGKELMAMFGGNEKVWVKGVVNPKESYLCSDGRWMDFADTKVKKELFGEMYQMMEFDNFPIKAYSTPSANVNLRVNGLAKLEIGKESTLSLVYKGDSGSAFDAPKITWELAEGSADNFTLIQDPQRPHVAAVTAKDAGEGLLYVTAEGIGTTVVRLTTAKKIIGAIGFPQTIVYNGKAQKPKPEVEDQDGEIIPPSHYTVKYKNNVKCGQGTVTVTIKSGDPKYTGSDIAWFTIRPRKAAIKSLTKNGSKMTVKVKNQKASGVKSYRVEYRVKGTSKWKTKKYKASAGTKLTVSGLRKGKRYQVRVCAVGPGGYDGAYSKVKLTKK
ncbi:MAG: fibronectin type III domain-containing protein [Firmicutes bacterium]|nr:fibronectin type III domain-containing protein [Bacillota bacterium]